MKALFRIRWMTQELMNGEVLIVRHWLEPINYEAQIMVHNLWWETNLA